MKKFPNKFIVFFFLFHHCYYPKKPTISPDSFILMLVKDPISILFIGDSLAERSKTFGLQEKLGPKVQIVSLARSGWDIPRWDSSFQDILQHKAYLIILGLGTNDANHYPTESFPLVYTNFTQKLKTYYPSSLFLHTLPPPTSLPILKEKIQTNNSWIQENYESQWIVDLFTLFEENSHLPLYPSWDPVHPHPIGYELIGNEYQKKIQFILNLNR